MIPAAIYLRVSREDQHPENQRPALEEMAKARGYEIHDSNHPTRGGDLADRVYVDLGISGAKGKADRPALRALLEDAARGMFRAVLVWALDRLSRDGSLAGGLQIVGELDRYKCAVLSYRQTWLDTSGPFREPLIALAFAMADEERRTLIERSKAGVERGRAEGKRPGRPPEPVPEHVQRLAGELRRAGMSWSAVSRKLAELGQLQPARMLQADRKRGVAERLRPRRPWPAGSLQAAIENAIAKGAA